MRNVFRNTTFALLLALLAQVFSIACSVQGDLTDLTRRIEKPGLDTYEINEPVDDFVVVDVVGICEPSAKGWKLFIGTTKITQVTSQAELQAQPNTFWASCDEDTKALALKYHVDDPNTARTLNMTFAQMSEDDVPSTSELEVNYVRPLVPPPVLASQFTSPTFTSDTTPTLSGTCSGNRMSHIEVSLDGGTSWLGDVIPCTSNAWTWTPGSALTGNPATAYSFAFRGVKTTPALEYSITNATTTITIDTVPPASSVSLAGIASNGSDTLFDLYLGTGLPRVSFGSNADTPTHQIVIRNLADTADICSVMTATTSPHQFDFSSCTGSFTTGTQYIVRLTSIDRAGNLAASATNLTVTADFVAPTATIAASEPATTFRPFNTFTFSPTDALSLVSDVECRMNSGSFAACTSPHNVTGLALGQAHTFHLQVTDKAGNIFNTSYTWTIDIDSTVPSCTLDASPALLNTLSQSMTFNCSDNDGVDFIECRTYLQTNTAGAFSTCTSPYNLTVSGDGQHRFEIRARDYAGNYSTIIQRDFNVDTTAPTTIILTGPTGETTDDTPEFTFSASDSGSFASGVASFECSVDMAAFFGCVTPVTLPTLADGPHSFRVRAIDNAGNISAIQTANFTVDTTAPNAPVITTPATDGLILSTRLPLIEWNSGGGGGSGQYRLKFNNADMSSGTIPSVIDQYQVLVDLPLGTNTVYLQERDSVGNWSVVATRTFEVYCTAGQYRVGAACIACSAGYYTTAPNLAPACTAASIGYYVPTAGQSSQTAAGPGHYQDQTAQSTQVACALGTASNSSARTTPCDACLEGTWAGMTGMTACAVADTGYVVTTVGSSTQTACPTNSTTIVSSNRLDHDSFSDCYGAGGYYGCAAPPCEQTDPGYYSPPGDDNQYPCAAGTYSSAPGATACTTCTNRPANASAVTYSAADSALTSNSCTVTAVTACDPGFIPDGTSCRTQCGAGLYWNGAACVNVGAGYYSPAMDDTRYQCQPGYYGSSVNNSTPTCDGPCAAGYYCETAGATTDQGDGACPAGLFCPVGTASPAANICNADTYSLGGATAASCTSCPVNSITNGSTVFNRDSLSDCRGIAGWWNCEDGTCDQAIAGYFSANFANSRTECSADTYSDTDTAGSCTTCPANSRTVIPHLGWATTPRNSLSACLGDAGYYNCQTGSCLPAGAGYISANQSNARTPCGPGTYSSTATASSCTACTNRPPNATAVTYAGTDSALTSDACTIASVTSCDAGYAPNGVVCDDVSPGSFAFTDQSNVNPSIIISSNAVTISGFTGPLTATCAGSCEDIARNGVWGGTSVSGFMPGDTIAIRVTSSASFNGVVTGSVSLGVTTSSTWTVTTRAGLSCTVAPFGTIAHLGTVTAYSDIDPLPPATCASVSETRTCNDGVLSGSFTGNTCNNGCNVAPFGPMIHSATVTAYNSTTPSTSCALASQTRTCSNGTLSGTHANNTCSEPCTGTPWGTVVHNDFRVGYLNAISNSCAAEDRDRYCTNGSFDPGGASFSQTSCIPFCPAGQYRSGSCVACTAGNYCTGNDLQTACTNRPANSTYAAGWSSGGGATNNCNWTCNGGYTESGGVCVTYGAYTYGAWSGWSCSAAGPGGCTRTRTESCSFAICHSAQPTSETTTGYIDTYSYGGWGTCTGGSIGSCDAVDCDYNTNSGSQTRTSSPLTFKATSPDNVPVTTQACTPASVPSYVRYTYNSWGSCTGGTLSGTCDAGGCYYNSNSGSQSRTVNTTTYVSTSPNDTLVTAQACTPNAASSFAKYSPTYGACTGGSASATCNASGCNWVANSGSQNLSSSGLTYSSVGPADPVPAASQSCTPGGLAPSYTNYSPSYGSCTGGSPSSSCNAGGCSWMSNSGSASLSSSGLFYDNTPPNATAPAASISCTPGGSAPSYVKYSPSYGSCFGGTPTSSCTMFGCNWVTNSGTEFLGFDGAYYENFGPAQSYPVGSRACTPPGLATSYVKYSPIYNTCTGGTASTSCNSSGCSWVSNSGSQSLSSPNAYYENFGPAQGAPAGSQTCTPGGLAPSYASAWSTGSWSACSPGCPTVNGTQTRSVTTTGWSNSPGGSAPASSQACTNTCGPLCPETNVGDAWKACYMTGGGAVAGQEYSGNANGTYWNDKQWLCEPCAARCNANGSWTFTNGGFGVTISEECP